MGKCKHKTTEDALVLKKEVCEYLVNLFIGISFGDKDKRIGVSRLFIK